MQIPHGSCNDTFSISAEAQQKLLNTPPAPLSEIYFECKLSPVNALTTALGLAMGNVILLRFSCILLAGLIVHVYVTRKKRKPSEHLHTYSTQEKQKVLEYLAFLLLLARDGRYGKVGSVEGGPAATDLSARASNEIQSGECDAISPVGDSTRSDNAARHGRHSLILALQREITASGSVRRFFELGITSKCDTESALHCDTGAAPCGTLSSGHSIDGRQDVEIGIELEESSSERKVLEQARSSDMSLSMVQQGPTRPISQRSESVGSESTNSRFVSKVYYTETVPNPLTRTPY